MKNRLKLIPYYTASQTLEEALHDPLAQKLLWLEILLNDSINWKKKMARRHIRTSFRKAGRWYGSFKSLIAAHIRRRPLPVPPGPIDAREYRQLLEALAFVSP